MDYSRRPERRLGLRRAARRPGRIAVLACAVSACLMWQLCAHAAGFKVQQARTRLLDGVYLLDAKIRFQFSRETLEALKNGVPLTVIIEMEIGHPREMLWDETVAGVEARRRLQLHALSGQYVLKDLNSGATRTYLALENAVEALGTIADFPLLDAYLLEGEKHYMLYVRARLDIEALPSPLRPLAYLSSLWRLESDWYRWPLER